jgi:hypothetical protein
MAPTPQQLVECLFYEVWMLGSTRDKLNRRDFKDQKTANALIDSFCIHARNLNEFFLEESKREDTLKASDFATASYKPPEKTEARKELFKKVHKQIAHLTNERTSEPDEKIGDPEREQMYGFLFNDLKKLF